MEKPEYGGRSIIAGSIGNLLEWYDFALYGYFAPVIAQQFFPSEDRLASLLATFGVFAAGYLTRPLGGVIFGRIADRSGRKRALQLSVLLMAIPTFLVGLLPNYAQIGAASSLGITLLRLLQGCSVGGEFTTSITFLADHARPGQRHRTGSWATFGALAGMMMGSGAGALVTSLLSKDQVGEWGWRVPFLCGLVVGLAGVALRRGMSDPVPEEASPPPLGEIFASQKGTMLKLTLGIWAFGTGFYMLFLYLSTYLSTQTGLAEDRALQINTVSMAVLVLLIPVAGYLADRFSGRSVLLAGYIGVGVLAYPLFVLMDRGSAGVDLVCQLSFAVVFALAEGALPGYLVSIFPVATRTTSISICYNTALALFGGTTPLVATALIAQTGDKLSPSYYLTAVAALSAVAICSLPTTDKADEKS